MAARPASKHSTNPSTESRLHLLSSAELRPGREPRAQRGTTRMGVVLETQTSCGEWLVEYLRDGERDFVLTSANGQLTIRARLFLHRRRDVAAPYVNGKVFIDWSKATVSHGERRTTLSRTELRLLAALIEGEGEPMDRAVLIARVWPAHRLRRGERENALAVYVHSLRKRLAAIGVSRVLRTVRGVGYKLDFKYLNWKPARLR